jgi:RimJ/RimL family protein N-acetyltransferase
MKVQKINIEDLQFLNETRNCYAQEFLHDSRTFTIEETQQWFFKTNPDYWIIWLNDERVGYFRLSNHSITNQNIYIGADIHPQFTGKGLGFLAYKEFMLFLFAEYNLEKISLEVLSTNERALSLYKKLGFIQEGVKRKEALKNGIFVDSIIMSILKDEIS